MVLKGQHVRSTGSSNSHNNTPNEDKREELFTIRVISNHTKIDALFDSGSQANLISEDLVKELKLGTIPHHKPYPLGWIVKDANLQVSRKCIFRFAIVANFVDEVKLDVVHLKFLELSWEVHICMIGKWCFIAMSTNIFFLKMG